MPDHSVLLGCRCPGHTESKLAELCLHQMHIHLLILGAVNPQEESSPCPRTRVQPTHASLSTSHALEKVLGGERDSTAEQLRSTCSKFLSLVFLEQGGGEREPGKVYATGVRLLRLWGEAVNSSLPLCRCKWCHILPPKGCKLTFSSGSVPFRKKTGQVMSLQQHL